MRPFTLTLSHPYKGMRERTTRQAEGKVPPSLGSGGPSLAAISLSPTEKKAGREKHFHGLNLGELKG